MHRIAILGARGYTAYELIQLLLRHPEAEITALTTRDDDRPHLRAVHPRLAGRLDLVLENLSPDELADRADFAFSCLPHAASASSVAPLVERGLRVVDFSSDYRFNDPAIYQQWYGDGHPNPEAMGTVPYGLPELFRDQIPKASLVANPGCYPTSAILALAPLLAKGLIEPHSIVVDSKSGVSGAGRNPKPQLHFPECNESFSAYSVGSHRHMPEIDHVLAAATKEAVEVIFTPHLVPMDRGIFTTAYAIPKSQIDEAQLLETYREFYAEEPFIRICEDIPSTKQVAYTNYCDLAVRLVRGRIVVLAVIDNLIKGASGAAVQNFNLMTGCAETTALL